MVLPLRRLRADTKLSRSAGGASPSKAVEWWLDPL
jgi:hypothetical protein